MNTHKILSNAGYTERQDYGQIAREAAMLVKGNSLSEEELLAEIKSKFGEAPQKQRMFDKPQPFTMFGTPGIDFEYEAIEQMKRVLSIPVSINGAMMPDAHVGYGMPIGGVAALDNAVSPGFVGYDIACRMTLTIIDITPDDFMMHREQIANDMQAVSSFGKGSGFEGNERRTHPVMDDPLWQEMNHLKQLQPLAWQQLGSSGGGNHFFDAVIGEVVDDAEWLPLSVGDKFVAIITHSGSRGTGHKLATHYAKLAQKETRRIAKGVPSGYEWLDATTDAGREYLKVMDLMGRYAQANHHLIHQHFLKRSKLGKLAQYENHHNFAWVHPDGKIIHRKGATPASRGLVGIIPGTSGTPSYIVEGLGNKESLESSSHGAGRPFSRTEAKRRHDDEFVKNWMEEQDILSFGLAPDETLMAYKDIDHVMSLQSDLVRTVARMLPKVVIMGGKSDDGD
jgi:tRNA-splicing ligase RtcB